MSHLGTSFHEESIETKAASAHWVCNEDAHCAPHRSSWPTRTASSMRCGYKFSSVEDSRENADRFAYFVPLSFTSLLLIGRVTYF